MHVCLAFLVVLPISGEDGRDMPPVAEGCRGWCSALLVRGVYRVGVRWGDCVVLYISLISISCCFSLLVGSVIVCSCILFIRHYG
jgi:hypothetical protein